MYIPLFILLTELFLPVSVPLLMQGGYVGLYQYERKLIAIDNANILIGRRERELFNWLTRANQRLKAADLAHDPIHACAHSPAYLFCGGEMDEPMEEALKAASSIIEQVAKARWLLIELEARKELQKWGVMSAHLERIRSIPVDKERCKFCWLNIFFKVEASQKPIRSHIKVMHGFEMLESHEELQGESLDDASWDYRLWARIE